MIDIAREVARIRYPVLAISALGWGVLVVGPSLRVPSLDVYCSAMGGGLTTLATSFSMTLALHPPSALAAWWALMLVAMMSPLIIAELHHIRFTSLARRRARSIALFVAGYGGIWMVCGVALISIGIAAMTLAPGSYRPAMMTGLIACVWQASPLKQRCLNKCHDHPRLRVFGWEADLDAFRFGWTHGIWCVGSCGWLMLFPLVLPNGHLMAMAAVAVLVFSERLEDSAPPRWKMRGFGKAGRMIAARLRIRRRMLFRSFDLLPEQ